MSTQPEAAGRICRDPQPAGRDAWTVSAISVDGQRRPCRGRGDAGSDRRRRDRPVPDRVPVPRSPPRCPAARASSGSTRKVLEAAGDKPVVFRTVDIGGDKALPYLTDDEGRGENPGDGLAGACACQPRTLDPDEGAGAGADRGVGRQGTCGSCSRWSPSRGNMKKRAPCSRSRSTGPKAPSAPAPKPVEFGAMLEVPSLAEMLDLLLPRVDFLSIGTNDLTQFLFAADRADPRLAERYDWLSPAILRFLRRVAAQASEAGVPVRVCGEMAGRPLEAMALIGIGIEQFLDHSGGGRTGQGDGPLARRRPHPDQGRAAARQAAARTCARRFPTGRGGTRSRLAEALPNGG